MENLVNISNRIIKELGTGFNEVIYQNAFKVELRLLGINYEEEVVIPIIYKGTNIGYGRADLILKNYENDLEANNNNSEINNPVNSQIIIEFKAINTLNGKESIQLKNYLSFTKIENGILINFNQKTGEIDYEILTLNE